MAKTNSDYETEIRTRYPEVQLLKAYVEANPEDKSTLKELETVKGKLRYYRDHWAESLDVTVYVANNEGLPNSAEELGYPTEPMPKYDAKKWPYYQTGDYQAYIKGIGWYPILRERKTLEDLDGTLRDKDHRKNLYEEFDRFLADDRFTIFRFDLECTEDEFFDYLPQWPKTCKFCEVKRFKMDSGDYFCPRMKQIFSSYNPGSDFRCHEGFVERERDPTDVQRIKTMRRTILRQCFGLGMQVVWRGNREAAYEAYRPELEEWAKMNYVRLLKLDAVPNSDRVFLENRLAQLEVDMVATRTALGVL